MPLANTDPTVEQSYQTEHDHLAKKGWVLIPGLLNDQKLRERLQDDLQEAYKTCRSIQVKNGIAENTDGTVHHLVGQADSFTELLTAVPFSQFLRTYFGGNFILNSYGGVISMKNKAAYVTNVHRDIRTFSDKIPMMANALIMLDDVTLEKGATYLLSGSHLKDERPDNETFFANADRAPGKAGTVLFFNSNLWHAAGINQTDLPRRVLTLTFTLPFLKQQLDYPRAMGYELADTLDPDLKQILGYNARVPSNLDEWYQPPAKRMYQPGQG